MIISASDSSLLNYLVEAGEQTRRHGVKKGEAGGARSDAAAAAAAAIPRAIEEKEEEGQLISNSSELRANKGGDDEERKWSFSWDPETDTQRMFLDNPHSKASPPPALLTPIITTPAREKRAKEHDLNLGARRSIEVANAPHEVQVVADLPIFVKVCTRIIPHF